MDSWIIERRTAPAGVLHADAAGPSERRVRVCQVERPAVVLGSTQRDDVLDSGAVVAAGVDVVRRRSGGGAVLVTPGDQVWIDLWLPAGDPLLVPDVSRSFDWVGELWRSALGTCGVEATRHQAGLDPCRWGRLVCFGGMGPGELAVDGRKVVGLSQRRGRSGARFDCSALLSWEPSALVALLALDPDDRRLAVEDLTQRAGGLSIDGGALTSAVLAHLP